MSASAALKNWPPTSGRSAAKCPSGRDRVDHRQAVAARDREVLGAERRRLVDQAGAVLDRDVVGQPDEVRARDVDEVERPGVRRVLQVGAGHPVEDLGVLAERGGQQRLGDDEQLVAAGWPGDDVGDGRVDRRPRCC